MSDHARGQETDHVRYAVQDQAGLDPSLSSTLPAMLEYEAAAQGVAFASTRHRDAIERFLARAPARLSWPAAEPIQPEIAS